MLVLIMRTPLTLFPPRCQYLRLLTRLQKALDVPHKHSGLPASVYNVSQVADQLACLLELVGSWESMAMSVAARLKRGLGL